MYDGRGDRRVVGTHRLALRPTWCHGTASALFIKHRSSRRASPLRRNDEKDGLNYNAAMSRAATAATSLELSGDGLTLADAERLLHGHVDALRLAPAARRKVERSRRVLMDLLESGATIYGVNTGFGKLANQRIEPHEVLALQENLLRSHAVGMGLLLPLGVARLAVALRIQALAKGYSGVTPELIDALIAVFNRGVVPAIPEQGSVGASGDLAPLAHLALVVIGEGHAFVRKPGRPASGYPDADATGGHRRTKPLSGRAAL